ncbi:MAG: 50S ribosomal protein L4, partial [Muribaculaceae bacterium]|nr:50S ribosomal protein L4 [Muribaculaceae bacterium]
PLLRGGGTVFGPRPRDYRTKLNKKMKQLAKKIALSSKAQNGGIFVVENFNFEKPCTKEWIKIAKSFNLDDKKTLLVMNDLDKNVLLSVRNVPNALMQQASDLNAYTLLNNDAILMTEGSVELINENF